MPDKYFANMTPEQRAAKNTRGDKWNKENTTRVYVRLNNRTDADILAKLESVENVQGYVKALIRADIAAQAGKEPSQEESSAE